jgi:hypothetical protein
MGRRHGRPHGIVIAAQYMARTSTRDPDILKLPTAASISANRRGVVADSAEASALARHGILDGGSQNLTLSRKIAEKFAEERQKEVARQATIDLALANPLPPLVTKENWHDWHRRGWIVCPAKRQRTCSDPACSVGAKCKRMAQLGLTGDGSPLQRKDQASCGAQTRQGTPCLVRDTPGKRRCRMHGGLSTGARTAEGKAWIAAAQRRRWAEWFET